MILHAISDSYTQKYGCVILGFSNALATRCKAPNPLQGVGNPNALAGVSNALGVQLRNKNAKLCVLSSCINDDETTKRQIYVLLYCS